jgi:hypothetical protein
LLSRPDEENSQQHPPICFDFSRYLIEAQFGAQPWHGGDIYERYVIGFYDKGIQKTVATRNRLDSAEPGWGGGGE